MINGQTCCSGGVPISSNLGLPFGEGQTLQFNLNYDLNNLNTQKTGAKIDGDRSRKRLTHATLLQVSYSLNDRWAIDGLFSYVRQERKLFRQGQWGDLTFTEGFGDMVLLLKYKLLSLRESSLSIWPGVADHHESFGSIPVR